MFLMRKNNDSVAFDDEVHFFYISKYNKVI